MGLTKAITSNPIYKREKGNFGMLAIGRADRSNVFYDTNYFCNIVKPIYNVISVTEEAYGHQTAVLVEKK